jgi:hypothetical protein
MFDLCKQMADAVKMPKNNTAPLLACWLPGCLLQQKGVLGFGPRVASYERAV